jgi:hypothetical protein
MRALLVFLLASLPYVAQAQEVDKVSAEGRGRWSITMNASGSLSILLDNDNRQDVANIYRGG